MTTTETAVKTDPILVPERLEIDTRWHKTDDRRNKDYRGTLEVLFRWPERLELLKRYRALRFQTEGWRVVDPFIDAVGEADMTNFTINNYAYAAGKMESLRIQWYRVAERPSEIPDEESMIWMLAKAVTYIGMKDGDSEGSQVVDLAKGALKRWACGLANEFYRGREAMIQEAEDIERAEAWLHDCARFYVERAKTECRYAQRSAALRAEVEVEAVMQIQADPPEFDSDDSERVRELVDKHMLAAVKKLASSTIGFRGGAYDYRIPRDTK